MTDPKPTPPPTGDPATLPPELATLETLLLDHSAGWQPPAALRAAILAGRRPATAPQARIDRQTRRWWTACAAAVLFIAALHLAVVQDLPTPFRGGLTHTAAPLARGGNPHPSAPGPQDPLAAWAWNPAFRAQLLSPAFRLVPAVDLQQFKRWTESETPGVGS